MDVDDAKKAQLVEAIAEHPQVKAAALLDDEGQISRLEGHAKVFRNGSPVDASRRDGEDDGKHEDVFLETVGGDYLVVVFPARQEFDPIKEEVDRLVDRLEL